MLLNYLLYKYYKTSSIQNERKNVWAHHLHTPNFSFVFVFTHSLYLIIHYFTVNGSPVLYAIWCSVVPLRCRVFCW